MLCGVSWDYFYPLVSYLKVSIAIYVGAKRMNYSYLLFSYYYCSEAGIVEERDLILFYCFISFLFVSYFFPYYL